MPKLPSEQRRDQQLNFSLTRDELTGLRSRADRAGMRLLDFGRFLLLRRDGDTVAVLSGQERPVGEEGPAPTFRILINEWKRVGNNLNQIARRLNYREEPPPPELDPLLTEIRDLLSREHGHDR